MESIKNVSDLRAYLSLFEPKYPIKNGYIARLLLVETMTAEDIQKHVKAIVQIAEPDKYFDEEALRSNVSYFKEKFKCQNIRLHRNWSLVVSFLHEPFMMTFKTPTAATSTSLQPEHASSTAALVLPDTPVTTHVTSIQSPTQLDTPGTTHLMIQSPVEPDTPAAAQPDTPVTARVIKIQSPVQPDTPSTSSAQPVSLVTTRVITLQSTVQPDTPASSTAAQPDTAVRTHVITIQSSTPVKSQASISGSPCWSATPMECEGKCKECLTMLPTIKNLWKENISLLKQRKEQKGQKLQRKQPQKEQTNAAMEQLKRAIKRKSASVAAEKAKFVASQVELKNIIMLSGALKASTMKARDLERTLHTAYEEIYCLKEYITDLSTKLRLSEKRRQEITSQVSLFKSGLA